MADGAQADADSFGPTISEDGRYVAFVSRADALVPGDTNQAADVFVYDADSDRLVRVSVHTDGTQGNGDSTEALLAAGSRYVVFRSLADNLVDADTNGVGDVFVRDLWAETTVRLSVSSGGTQSNASSFGGSIDGSGGLAVFLSLGSNLGGVDENGVVDVFLRDLAAGTTVQLTSGADQPSFAARISDDASVIAVESASRLGGDAGAAPRAVYLSHLSGDTVFPFLPAGSPDGPPDGESRAVALSADGGSAVFESDASNLVSGDGNGVSDVFLVDTFDNTLLCITDGDAASRAPAIAASGRYVAFASDATNLVPFDTNSKPDVFIYEVASGIVERVSVDGSAGPWSSGAPAISSDGTRLAFEVATDGGPSQIAFTTIDPDVPRP